MLKELLSGGSKIPSSGYTPLHGASEAGHKEIVELLLSGGADINVKDERRWTPLCYACYEGNKEIVKLLLSKGAEVNIENDYGWTPLYASLRGYYSYDGPKEIIVLLLSYGADVNVRDNRYGKTPLHEAADRGWNCSLKSI